jgi:hypothetical protein
MKNLWKKTKLVSVALWKWARKVFKTVLRFFNLLEPDVPYMVLSLSKMSVWMTLGLTVYVVSTGSGLSEIGGALIANVGAIGNYAYRRRMQVHTRTGGYGGYGQFEPEVDPFANQMPIPDLPTGEVDPFAQHTGQEPL